jgi:hypothetical protein
MAPIRRRRIETVILAIIWLMLLIWLILIPPPSPF